jgi:hypothetical protein
MLRYDPSHVTGPITSFVEIGTDDKMISDLQVVGWLVGWLADCSMHPVPHHLPINAALANTSDSTANSIGAYLPKFLVIWRRVKEAFVTTRLPLLVQFTEGN